MPVTQSDEAVGGQLSSTSASSRMSLVSTSSANSDVAMVASSLSDATSDTPPGVPGSVAGLGGIPTQALTGMEHALGAGRLDPFDMFPVTLTAQHHKLLHHCAYHVCLDFFHHALLWSSFPSLSSHSCALLVHPFLVVPHLMPPYQLIRSPC